MSHNVKLECFKLLKHDNDLLQYELVWPVSNITQTILIAFAYNRYGV